MHDRKIHVLLIGCGTIFVALFITNFLDYINKLQENDYIEWDVKTLTSGDYTVSVEIDDQFYDDFRERELDGWIQKCLDFCTCC